MGDYIIKPGYKSQADKDAGIVGGYLVFCLRHSTKFPCAQLATRDEAEAYVAEEAAKDAAAKAAAQDTMPESWYQEERDDCHFARR